MALRPGRAGVRVGSPYGNAAERLDHDGICVYVVDATDPTILHVYFHPSRLEAN